MMAISVPVSPGVSPNLFAGLRVSARLGRLCMMVVVGLALLAGFTATGQHAAAQAVSAAGPELTHLLRAMAALKMLFAAAAIGAVAWRLAAPVGWMGLTAYTLTSAAMAAGPGLIWDMAHVRWGALLLHGGLLGSVLLLWRDPATATRLHQAIAVRRARLTASH